MSTALGVAATALPFVVVIGIVALIGLAFTRSLRDEAVLDALRAEVRSVGEVHRAVLEARTSSLSRPAPR